MAPFSSGGLLEGALVGRSRARYVRFGTTEREGFPVISTTYVQRMARYNRWQNENLYGGADKLPALERTRQSGAFFGSIQGTLSHLLWADQHWMRRFDPASPAPRAKSSKESPHAYNDWSELRRDRSACDAAVVGWADTLDAAWLDGDLVYFSGIAQREITLAKWIAVTHFFNHQAHHRGRVHCMLTQAGVKPADTDLPFLPA